MDIRRKTALIVRKENEFLVGTILHSTDMRWSIYPWDAWSTRDRSQARAVAAITGGDLYLFNPVAGQLRRYEGGGRA